MRHWIVAALLLLVVVPTSPAHAQVTADFRQAIDNLLTTLLLEHPLQVLHIIVNLD